MTCFKMERAKVGDMHGAFAVISDLDAAVGRGQRASLRVLLVGSLVALGALVGIGWLIKRHVTRPLGQAGQALRALADRRLDHSSQISGTG